MELVETTIAERNTSWYNISTKMEKYLLVTSAIILSTIVVLAIALSVILQTTKVDVCWTSTCIQKASSILQYLNQTIDPCHDFYQFTCGNYHSEYNEELTWLSTIQDSAIERMKVLIEGLNNASKSELLLQRFYNVCNNDINPMTALEDIKVTLAELGGWPILEEEYWRDISFVWVKPVYKAKKLGLATDFVLDLQMEIDIGNPSRYINTIDKPAHLRKYKNLWIDRKYIKAYYDFIVYITVSKYGANRTLALAELKDVVEFEVKLSKCGIADIQRTNITNLYNIRKIKDLQHKYPSINWFQYIQYNIATTHDKVMLTSDESVMVKDIKYLQELLTLLNRTPKRVQANYIMLRVVLANLEYFETDLSYQYEEFYKEFTGRFINHPRWKKCIRSVWERLPLATDMLYATHYLNEVTRANFEIVVTSIKLQFRRNIMDNKWLDSNSKLAALEKIDMMSIFLGYPEEFYDEERVNAIYSNVEIGDFSYVRTVRVLNAFVTKYQYQRFQRSAKMFDEHDAIKKINFDVLPKYSPTKNCIVIPVMVAEALVSDKGVPSYISFGTLGYIIASELSRAFNYEGVQYNGFGKLEEIWWTGSTKLAYLEKSSCLIDVFGLSEAGQELSKIMGIQLAHSVFQDTTRMGGSELRLPGLDYTNEQLFWVVAAQMYCSKNSKGYSRTEDSNRYTHLYKLDGFANDFNCPLFTNLNECTIL